MDLQLKSKIALVTGSTAGIGFAIGSGLPGEGATVGAPGAVIHAILDALAPLGVTHIDMPATPARVWQAIQSARRRGARD